MPQTLVLSWTVPTPRGLWHRAVIAFDKGLIISPDIDTTLLERVNEAASDGPRAVVEAFGAGARAKQPDMLGWNTLTGVVTDVGLGTLELQGADRTVTLKIADRERLDKIGRALEQLRLRALA